MEKIPPLCYGMTKAGRSGLRHRLLLIELHIMEAFVETLSQHYQLIMAAEFFHLTRVKNHDLMGVADGGQTMGDDHGGAAFDEFFDGLLDYVFGLGVYG